MNLTSCMWRPAPLIKARSCAHASEDDIMSCRSYFGEPLILHTLEAPPAVWPEAGVQVCHLPL